LAKRGVIPLRSGTFVVASIEGRTQENAVVLPRQALRGKDRLWVMSDNKLIFRKVKVAFANAEQVVVTDGIRTGEQVITSLLAGAIDGMAVKVREPDSTNE